MTAKDFENLCPDKLNRLPEFRKTVYQNCSEKKTMLFCEKYWDLLCLFEGQWHYITTQKISPHHINTMSTTSPTDTLTPGQNINYHGTIGYVLEALEKNQYWVRLHHPPHTQQNQRENYALVCGSDLIKI